MDPREWAVLIEKQGIWEDRTTEVVDLRPDGERIHVSSASGRSYRYGVRRVVTFRYTRAVPIGPDVAVAVDGEIREKVTAAWHFAGPGPGWWHLLGDAGECEGCSGERVTFVRNEVHRPRTADVLRYWREVAALLPDDSDSLRRGLADLTFVHPDSALHLFLEGMPFQAHEHSMSPAIYPFHTNRSQREAIDNALHQPISVIDGPPGTGKTQTILNLIANIIVDESKSVAVVSSNNAAVENVRDKLIEAGFGYIAADLGRSEKRKQFLAGQAPRNAIVAGIRASAQPEPPSEKRLTELDKRLCGLQETERELAQLLSQLAGFELERRHFQGYLERHELPPEENFRCCAGVRRRSCATSVTPIPN